MAEYQSLSRQPSAGHIDDSTSSGNQSRNSFHSTLDGSSSGSDSPSEQHSAETHALESEWTSPTEFIEICFRSSIDLSNLTAAGWMDRRSYASEDSQLFSVPHGHRNMESDSGDNLMSKRTFFSRIKEHAAPGHSPTDSSERKMWNPIWLTNAFLASFVVLFVGLFFVVLALYLYSEAHSGLLNGSEGYHYLWTYLPTTIFVLSTSLWHQVDFYCKELTPYDKMKQGPTSGSHSILLDYITPIIPSGLWQASKYRHWAVVASIVGYLVLHLCTILSAGLLFLSPVRMSKSTDSLVMLSNFSAAKLNLADVTAGPVDAVYGVKSRDLPWTYGTTENLVVHTFDYNGTDDLSNAILTAEVPGFSVVMDCAPAQVGNLSESLIGRPWNPDSGILAEYLVGDISDPGCQLNNVSLGQTPAHMLFTENINKSTGWKSNHQGFFDVYVCNSGFDYVYAEDPSVPQPNATSPEDYRFLLTVSEVTFFLNNSDNDTMPDSHETTNWTISQSTAVLCKPSYSVDLYTVTPAPLNTTLLKADKIANTSADLEGFNVTDLLDGIVNALTVSNFGEGGADYVATPVPHMFMLLEGLNNNSRLEPLAQPGLLENLSTQALQGIGTQFAEQHLKQDQSQPLNGSIVITQQRLQVKRLTVGLLLTTIGLLAITALVLIKIRPWDTAPCATESLASAATILAASDALRERLQKDGPDLNASVRSLENRDYQTLISPEGSFIIQPVVPSSFPSTSLEPSRKKPRKNMPPWWRPIATRKWFLACILLIPLILIAVLEAIQRISDRKHGIAEMKSSDDYHLAISYVPVSVMLLVAMMYGSLNDTVSVFAPFLALRRGDAQATRSISASLISKLPVHALYLSLCNNHWANSFTISAALISSFLTIVTSGLYSPASVQSFHAVQMQQTSNMDLSHINLSEGDNLAGETTKLIMLFNASNPSGTYNNLIFPSFDAHIPDSFLGSNTTFEGISISMKLPALRPALQCTVAPAESISNTDSVYHSGVMQLWVDGTSTYGDPGSGVFSTQDTTFPWALATSNATLAKQQGLANWRNTYIIPNDTETLIPITQVGFASSVLWVEDGNETNLFQTADTRTESLDVDPSAANFGFAAGQASGTKTYRLVNISLDGAHDILASTWDMKTDQVIALCYQVLEEVQTNVTFDWPSMTTSLNKPPVPDESTARIILSNESSTPTWFMNTTATATSASPHWFGISLNMFLWALQDNDTSANWLTGWFTTLENRRGGQPLSELLGQANQDKLIKASSQLYARYAVQAINANMRVSGAPDLPSYNATLSLPVLRLQQNKGPKIVLQVLLGVMVVCGAIAYFLMHTKEVLRQSPCSIAGKMDLLSRSELCNTRKVISEGAEWWDESRRRRNGLFDGWFFSLGWWGEGTKWYGVDVGSAEKME